MQNTRKTDTHKHRCIHKQPTLAGTHTQNNRKEKIEKDRGIKIDRQINKQIDTYSCMDG